MTVTDNLFLSIQIIVHKMTQAQIDRHTNRQRTQTYTDTDTDTVTDTDRQTVR